MRFVSPLVAVLLVVAAMLAQQNTAYAVEPSLSGTVTDITTGQPVANVCVTVGPPVRCATNTKADGTYFLDMTGAPNGIQWDIRFLLGGQIKKEFLGTTVTGPTVINAQIDATGFITPASPAARRASACPTSRGASSASSPRSSSRTSGRPRRPRQLSSCSVVAGPARASFVSSTRAARSSSIPIAPSGSSTARPTR